MSNCAWKLNRKLGVAYLEDRELLGQITNTEGSRSKMDKAVMATYFSPKGKPFAWQVSFLITDWDRVARALGMEIREPKPVRAPAKAKDRRTTSKAKPAAVTSRQRPQSTRKKST